MGRACRLGELAVTAPALTGMRTLSRVRLGVALSMDRTEAASTRWVLPDPWVPVEFRCHPIQGHQVVLTLCDAGEGVTRGLY